MDKLIAVVLPIFVEAFLKMLKPEQLNRIVDRGLDWCETAISNSKTEYDDALVLPLIGILREAFNIPDND